jgi:preprotein translocase SecE subunit
MLKFIKNAIAELEHVVWPTPNESKKYMIYTVGVILIMASLLAIIGYTLRWSLWYIRDQFDHEALSPATGSEETLATEEELKKLQEQISKKKQALSGATIEVQTSSGGTNTGTGNKQ